MRQLSWLVWLVRWNMNVCVCRGGAAVPGRAGHRHVHVGLHGRAQGRGAVAPQHARHAQGLRGRRAHPPRGPAHGLPAARARLRAARREPLHRRRYRHYATLPTFTDICLCDLTARSKQWVQKNSTCYLCHKMFCSRVPIFFLSVVCIFVNFPAT